MSTSDIKSDINSVINNLYAKAGYMDKYGTDVWAAVILCIIFLIVIFYLSFFNGLEVIRSDWDNRKCDPSVLLFAGYINKPTNQSNLEYTAENFSYCVNSMLEKVTAVMFQPLYFLLNSITLIFNGMVESVQQLRKLLLYLREQFDSIAGVMFVGLSNITVPFINMMVKIKDSLGKINGILTSALYTLFGSYMAMQSLFLVIIDLIILILIIICCMIIAWIAIVYYLPFCLGCWGFPFLALTTLVFIAILIPVIWFKIMMDRIMALSTPKTPRTPTCFVGDTLVELNNGLKKEIREIAVGDILKHEIKVTSTLKLSGEEQHLYKLNGVVVTGEHRVFHQELKWIKVKAHPAAIYLPEQHEAFVYCLNTDKKAFIINETVFSDWDDIDNEVVADLNQYCVKKGYLPENFSNADIHNYLNNGLHPATKIKLQDGVDVDGVEFYGVEVEIANIQVNDVLCNGETVKGVIKIDAHDLYIYEHEFVDIYNITRQLCCSKNIVIEDNVLGKINLMEAKANKEKQVPYLYHLLTDTGYFTVNNIQIHDYNFGIDAYLSKQNKV